MMPDAPPANDPAVLLQSGVRLDVLPVLSGGNLRNRPTPHPIDPREFFVARQSMIVETPNLQDFRTGQNCRVVPFTLLDAISRHIFHVVGVCADRQMVRTDARWDSADDVANMQTGRDWPIVQFPGNTVRVGDKAATSSRADSAMPGRDFRSDPKPAGDPIINLDDLFPKPFNERALSPWSWGLCRTGSAAELGLTEIEEVGLGQEPGCAVCADAGNGTLMGHLGDSFRGVTPRAVDAAPGFRVPEVYHCQRCGKTKPSGYAWSHQYAYKLTGTIGYVLCRPCVNWAVAHPAERMAEPQP